MRKILSLLTILGIIFSCSNDDSTEQQQDYFPTNITVNSQNGESGEILTINGNGFLTNENYVVTFTENEIATITEINSNYLKVEIPENAVSGNISLTYNNQTEIIGNISIENNNVINTGRSFVLVWNRDETNVIYQIKEIDLATGILTNIGSSSEGMMDEYYDLDEIYYNETNNSIVALHNKNAIWSYDISTNTDKIIKLDNTENPYYRDLVVSNNGRSFVLVWDGDETNVIYQIKEIDLATGILTNIGSSSEGMMDEYYDLDEIYYDETNNSIVALHNRNAIWSYDISTNTDKIIKLDNTENPYYRDLSL